MKADMPTTLVIDGVRYVREDAVDTPPKRVERTYTVSQICEMTGYSKSTVNAAIRRRELTAVAPNGGVRYRRIKESDFLAWEASKASGSSSSPAS